MVYNTSRYLYFRSKHCHIGNIKLCFGNIVVIIAGAKQKDFNDDGNPHHRSIKNVPCYIYMLYI